MNCVLILAGGVGQRMRNTGLPKQFLEVHTKPVIIYTIEKFEYCDDIDKIVVCCNPNWVDYFKQILVKYPFTKVDVVKGGKDRNGSIMNGLMRLEEIGTKDDDIILIHDAVRPLVSRQIIEENIRVAREKGAAMTVRPVIESVVVTDAEDAEFDDFKKRDDTYSLTAPQAFEYHLIKDLVDGDNIQDDAGIPLLDMAMIYTYLGNKVGLVKENNMNIKITTPEDFIIFKSMIEFEESKQLFGI